MGERQASSPPHERWGYVYGRLGFGQEHELMFVMLLCEITEIIANALSRMEEGVCYVSSQEYNVSRFAPVNTVT